MRRPFFSCVREFPFYENFIAPFAQKWKRSLFIYVSGAIGGGLPKSEHVHINVVFHRNNDLSGEIDKVIDGSDVQM